MLRRIRLLLDRDQILLDRFGVSTQLMKRIAEFVVCFRIVGTQLDRFAQFVDSFRVAPEIVQTPAEVVLRGRTAGPECQTLFVFSAPLLRTAWCCSNRRRRAECARPMSGF